MAASAAFSVNSSTPTGAVAVAASSTVNLALLSTSGVDSVAWSIVGNHSSGAVDPTITPAGSPVGATASFPMPAGAGQAYLVRCVVNGGVDANGDADAALTKRHIVGVNDAFARVPLATGENLERSATHGWTEHLNDLATNFSGSSAAIAPCRLAATANIANLSNAGANMDGAALVVADRVLLPLQTTATQNGVYVVSSLTPTVLTRATDMAVAASVNAGITVAVQAGDTHRASTWTLLGDGALTVGTDALRWTVDETWVDVRRFGAKLDGSTDDTQAVKDARDSLGATGGVLFIPRGNLVLTDEIVISNSRVHVEGEGKHVTTVTFNPSAAGKAAFSFTAGASVLYQCGLRHMSFISGNVTDEKIAVRATDTSEFVCEDIAVLAWTGGTSKGIQLRGREATLVQRVSVQADRPISIEVNPNNASLSCDHLHMADVYLLTLAATGAAIHFDDADVNVTNLTMGGTNPIIGGKYAIYWPAVGGAGSQQSLSVQFKNIRYEQTADASGYAIRVEHLMTGLTIDNVLSGGNKGFYVRAVRGVSIRDCLHPNANEALNIDGCYSLVCDNFFRETGSTSTYGSMVQQFALAPYPVADSPYCEVWTTPLADEILRVPYEISIEAGTSYTLSDAFSTTDATPHDTTIVASVPTNKHGTYDVTVWVTGVNQTSGALCLLCKRLAVIVADDGSCTAAINNALIGDQVDPIGVGGLALTFAGTPAALKATVTGAGTDLEWSLKADVLAHLVDHELGH